MMYCHYHFRVFQYTPVGLNIQFGLRCNGNSISRSFLIVFVGFKVTFCLRFFDEAADENIVCDVYNIALQMKLGRLKTRDLTTRQQIKQYCHCPLAVRIDCCLYCRKKWC